MYFLNTNAQIQLYQRVVNSQVFVDKSLLIEKISKVIGTDNAYLCITRPRRFGKTINANMLGAYYTKGYDSHPIFGKLAIAGTKGYGGDMNRYNVIHMDFSVFPDYCSGYGDYIRNIMETLREDLKEYYPELASREYRGLSRMLQDTGETFLFILDEWDSVFYEKFMAASSVLLVGIAYDKGKKIHSCKIEKYR